MSKLYSKYLLEKEGKETLEIPEKGFVTYKLLGDICHICILFVNGNYRRGDIARQLMDEVVRKKAQNCKAFTAAINTKQFDTSRTTVILLRYGFEVVGAENGDILLYKDIKIKD